MRATASAHQERERRAFDDIVKFLRSGGNGLSCNSITFRAIGGSALTDKSISVPENGLGAPGPQGSVIPVT